MLFPRLTPVNETDTPKGTESLNKREQRWPERFARLAEQSQHPLLKAYYQAGVPAPDTPVSEIEFVAMDFETTGLDPEKNAIVSIGLVPFTLKRIRCRASQHWILSPEIPLQKESVVIHGITHSDVRQAPDLIEILPELLEALAGRIPVVHYQAIERPFLNLALLSRLGEGIIFPLADTLALEARIHRSRRKNFWRYLKGQAPVSIRLADSRQRYNLPYYAPHHALTDALATAELLIAQIADRYSPDTPIGELWE